MDLMDETLRDYLVREKNARRAARPWRDCPEPEEVYLFVTQALQGERLDRLMTHLKDCPEDQSLVARVRGLLKEMPEASRTRVPRRLLNKVKSLGQPVRTRHRVNLLWLAGALGAFSASFFMPRYFVQWLCLSLLLGIKWIVDRKAARTQIMIYKALKESQDEQQPNRWRETEQKLDQKP